MAEHGVLETYCPAVYAMRRNDFFFGRSWLRRRTDRWVGVGDKESTMELCVASKSDNARGFRRVEENPYALDSSNRGNRRARRCESIFLVFGIRESFP